MTVFMSKYTSYAIRIDGKRLQFAGGYYYCDDSVEAEKMQKSQYYGVHFCLESDYPLRFGDNEKHPNLLKNALVAQETKRKISDARIGNLESENARLKAELEKRKQGKSVVHSALEYVDEEPKPKPKPRKKSGGRPRKTTGGR